MDAIKALIQQPLWWVLPAILVGSFLVNHKEISNKLPKNGKGNEGSKGMSSPSEAPAAQAPVNESAAQNTNSDEAK